jgi:predicted dehydrogenase
MKIKKILIIGLGSIGSRHLNIAKSKFPQAQIRVLRSSEKIDTDTNKDFFYNPEDAIAFDPQIVFIANPANFHLSSATPFIKNNRYFFIEKPISNNLDEAKKFLEICKKENSMVQVGYNLRFLSSLKKFKNYIDKGIIGDIWSIRSEIGQYLPSWRPKSDYRQTVSAKKSLGGGVVNELSHEIDYLLWIFGNIKWIRAITSKQSDLDVDVEDSAYIQMGFQYCQNKNLIASLNMDFIRHDRKRECIVIGSKGSIKWNGINGTVEIWKKGSNAWSELFNLNDLDESYGYEWDDMALSYLNKNEPLINGNDGLKTLHVINNIIKSSESEGKIMKMTNLE